MNGQDDYENENNIENENDEEIEYDDTDNYEINDYENQDEGIDLSAKTHKNEEEDEDEDIILEDKDYTIVPVKNKINIIKGKKSNIKKISKYEYSKIYGILTKYIVDSSINVPEEMLNEEEVKSGDAFRISRFWIENRKKYKLPLNLYRNLYLKVNETIELDSLLTESDLSFRDEESDHEKFWYNFRDKPYDISA